MFEDLNRPRRESELLLPGDREFEEELAARAADMLGVLIGSYITEADDSLFDKQEAIDIFEATRNAVEYADENDVSAIVLVDKSARPMWVSFKEYWQHTHAEGEPAPEIFFAEPAGFRKMRRKRSTKKREKMEADHPYLNDHKEDTVLVIDTCIHTGKTARGILNFMDDCGFEDVRFAVLHAGRNYSPIEPDTLLLDRLPQNRCYPFSRVGFVTEPAHTNDHLYAKRWEKNKRSPERIRRVRDEIREIIRSNVTREDS